MARRVRNADGSTGDWRHISYAQALASARSIGQALLDRGLNAERPVAILSENDLEHALLALGCLYAGVPYCPVSPAYSTVSQDYDKLRHVLTTLTPGPGVRGRQRTLWQGHCRHRGRRMWRW
jgi:feruloyl-CoA synthase